MTAKEVISQLTVEEKCALLSGKNEWMSRDIKRLGIQSIVFSDGPHGLRKQGETGDHLGLGKSLPATCFPTAATVASSWDKELAVEIGEALGQEANAQGVNVLLGPGLNIKRSPLCGRNFEYFSEDPYLAGKMAAGYIKGIQKKGVYACPKHFAVNSREYRRMAMNAVVDERTLREIYLTAFEIAVQEGGALAIMSSYNSVNGDYANENNHLLKEILREEWGFNGLVVTDWGGSNDHVEGVKACSNVEMPTPGLGPARELLKALDEGRITEAQIDAAVTPVIEAALFASEQKREDGIREKEHHDLARKAAEKSAVLLKNDDSILPLRKGTKVAVIGDFAFTPRYQGAGSSVVNATKVESIAEIIEGYPVEVVGMARGYVRTGKKPDRETYGQALELAKKADVVLYFFGLDEISETEGADRLHMRIPSIQTELLEDLYKVNQKIVGVLSAGSAVETPWIGNCKALLNGLLTGQAGGSAIMNILTGKVNPSGKLAESWPVTYDDCSVVNYSGTETTNLEYREGVFIGYRYYEKAGVTVRFPFGFGLGYSAFRYDDLQVDAFGVNVKVTNTGEYDGEEVVQMYVGLKDSKLIRPVKELKGFEKVSLKAGETKTVRIPFDGKTFRFFNAKSNAWETEDGIYEIFVGPSSRTVALSGTIELKGSMTEVPYDLAKLPSYASGRITDVSAEEFKILYGAELPVEHTGELRLNDPFCKMGTAKSGVFRLVYRILKKNVEKAEAKGTPDLNSLFIYNMPVRALSKMAGNFVSMEMCEAIVTMANGHFFKGLGRVIAGFFRNRRENRKYESLLK
ncbi:MAG: glycoside hydrolase family 3 C-terminal domain-containing protein [Lachnospiraceae bacterium]|nr:glycoside hydrolase family 3 C-terminal domain-containing protein [Lachnospiraceae bacterium]